MWVKGTFLLMFALFIDALQAIMALVFLTMGSAIAAGAPVVGSVTVGTVACVIGGVVAAIFTLPSGGSSLAAAAAACAALGAGGALAGGAAGAAAGAMGPPLGIAVGFAVDIAISLTMGSGLILALILFGMFDLKFVGAVFIGEAIPGLDALPGWTLLVIRCILKKNAEQTMGIAGVASSLASGALSPGSATGLGVVTSGLSAIKNHTGVMARRSPEVREQYDSEPAQGIARERTQLASDVGKEIGVRPQNKPSSTSQLHAKTT